MNLNHFPVLGFSLCLLMACSTFTVSGQSSKLLWLNQGFSSIMCAEPDGSNPSVLIARDQAAYHAIHPTENKIYWSDPANRTVNRSNLDGSMQEVFLSGLSALGGIAITEANEIFLIANNSINRYDSDGSLQEVLQSDLAQASDLIVYQNQILWAERGTSTIKAVMLDGSGLTTVIANAPSVNDLDVHAASGTLYWNQVTGFSGTWGLYSADLNGDNRTQVIEDQVIGFLIDNETERLYWTLSNFRTIQRAPLDNPEASEVVLNQSVVRPVRMLLNNADNRLYFSSNAYRPYLYRFNAINGSGLQSIARSSVYLPVRFELDTVNQKIYWINGKSGVLDDQFASIMRANFDGTAVEELVRHPTVRSPFGLALDIAQNKMYWSDISPRALRQADLDGNNISEVIPADELESIRDIALDHTQNKLYWSDPALGSIHRVDLIDSTREEVITGLNIPTKIVLSPSTGMIYWADFGDGLIARVTMDGENRDTIFSAPTPVSQRINSLSIDEVNELVYFTIGAPAHRIQQVKMDGTDLQEILTLPNFSNPQDIYILNPSLITSTSAVPATVSIAEAFPNPFYGEFEVRAQGLAITDISLYDYQGRMIHRQSGLQQKTMTVSAAASAPNGLYFLRLSYSDGSREVLKLVKQ